MKRKSLKGVRASLIYGQQVHPMQMSTNQNNTDTMALMNMTTCPVGFDNNNHMFESFINVASA
jgi:hypothetical protein